MPGLLSVVATPIGNLDDITLRALRVLQTAQLIAAEDTRHTAKLLRHFGITTPTVSFHEHNAARRTPQLLARMRAGDHIALVTDAGTPSVSDPGLSLVAGCRASGVHVQPLPGASAPLSAAVASGFPVIPLTILGFPPVKSRERTRWFAEAAAIRHTFTFFEAPHRVDTALDAAVEFFGERQIFMARELTKIHESYALFWLKDRTSVDFERRGEFTMVVGPAMFADQEAVFGLSTDDVGVRRRFEALTATSPGVSRRDLIAEVAASVGLSNREVFAALERTKPE